MNKVVSIVLLAGGIVAVVYGINASQSVASSFSRLFTGAPTDGTIWLLIGGAIAAAIGASGLVRSGRAR